MAQLTKPPAEELSIIDIDNVKPALSGWPMVIFWIGMIIFACQASTHMVGAGDTWVALACGRHFVNHGVNTVEPFSANSHRAGPTDEDLKTWPKWITDNFSPETIRYWHPTGWINQNWLTHVIFYELVEMFGSPGKPYYDALVIWKFLIYIIAVAVVFYTGKYLGVNPALSAVFACFALFIGRSFLDIRPAGFSNLLVAVFLLVLVLTTYRNILYIWLVVPMVILWCNLHGGYLYAFIMLAPFIGIHLILSVPRKWFVPVYAACSVLAVAAYAAKAYLTGSQDESTFYNAFLMFICLAVLGVVFYFFIRPRAVAIGVKGVVHTIVATTVAFIGMIVFNPFHLTNLTHTYVISISKHAELWRSVNEWHSAWEWTNPVGTAIPFLIMFIIGLAAFAIWFLNWLFKPAVKPLRVKAEPDAVDFDWPKMDLALIVIAAMTVYMAIQSRRFIPIAAVAACPIIALFIDQTIRMVAVRVANPTRTRLALPAMPMSLQRFFAFLAAAAVIGFGGFWGYKFYRVYLGPFPDDDQYTSVFMRMTASYAKPFDAGAFIRDNHLKGDMFNYWTEGGFIAWIQEPDPKTGKTPLQLFMDGRAQAAYEPSTYDLWMSIMSGTPPTLEPILASGRRPTPQEVSNALDEELRKHNVWLVLMPYEQFDTPLVDGLERHPDWRVVFLSNKQKMLISIKTKEGEQLFLDMINGKAKFPDEFSQFLSTANALLPFKDEDARKRGFEFAVRAFEMRPSQMALTELINAMRYPAFKPQVEAMLKEYMSKFEQKQAEYAQQNGYMNKLIAALIISNYFERTSNDPRLRDQYRNKGEEYKRAQVEAVQRSRW
jgi:hypothetical protein